MHTKKAFNTHWIIEFVDPNNRFEAEGAIVTANAPTIIKHAASNQYLGSDTNAIKTDYGREYEVMAHTFCTQNKS